MTFPSCHAQSQEGGASCRAGALFDLKGKLLLLKLLTFRIDAESPTAPPVLSTDKSLARFLLLGAQDGFNHDGRALCPKRGHVAGQTCPRRRFGEKPPREIGLQKSVGVSFEFCIEYPGITSEV